MTTKGKIKAWGITINGQLCTWGINHTRKSAIKEFEDNIVQPPHQSSEPRLTIKDFPSYKPVRVLIEVMK